MLDRAPFVQVHLPDGTSQHIVIDQDAATRVGYLDSATRGHFIVKALCAALIVYGRDIPDAQALTQELLTRLIQPDTQATPAA